MKLRFSSSTPSWAWFVCIALSPLVVASAARGELTVIENADGQQGLTVYKMTVTPAAAPVPVLKHRLVPGVLEMRPGNAVLYYLRAVTENGVSGRWKSIVKQHGEEEVDGDNGRAGWTSTVRPLRELPIDKLRDASLQFDVIFDQYVKRAWIREDCDWGRNIEELEGLDVIGLLLPEVQEIRGISRMLILRTRVAVADGDFDRAIEHLKINYRLGYHMASDPILVCGLVGIAMASTGNAELPELIAAKGSPNLYWALAELPRPFIDLYPATRLELSWGAKIFPVMYEPEKQRHSPEEWARLLANSMQDMQRASSAGGQVVNEWVARAGLSVAATMMYPDAKRRLAESGMTADEIEQMPVGQVIAIDASREYMKVAQEFEKWWYMPYGVAKKQLPQLDTAVENKFAGGYGRILASLMLPALNKVRDAQMRLDWELNGLQTVELIRMHAAETGKLPAALDEITVAPVPKNPITERDFQYRLDGETAILELPLSDGFSGYARRYEITLAK
jgi:hypothetical protein